MSAETMRTVERRLAGFLSDNEPAIAIPAAFFTDLLPQIVNLAELHLTLTAFRLVAEAGGIGAPIAERTLLRDKGLRQALRPQGSPRQPTQRILEGVELALSRGTLLRFVAEHGKSRANWYYVNTPDNRSAVAAMERGEQAPPAEAWIDDEPPVIRLERPTIFRLYEQNIGPLTPLVADRIVKALDDYPSDWIEDGIEEAVAYNRRSWRYIERILENWSAEGRTARER